MRCIYFYFYTFQVSDVIFLSLCWRIEEKFDVLQEDDFSSALHVYTTLLRGTSLRFTLVIPFPELRVEMKFLYSKNDERPYSGYC